MFIIKEGTPADKIGEGTDPQTLTTIQNYLTKQGLVIRTADQEKSYTETLAQQKMDEATSKLASNIEKDVEELTGIKRNANEKYYEYYKRATSERLKEVDGLKAKIADWEKKGGAGSEQIIADLKTQLASAQEQYAAEKQKLTGELTTFKQQMFNVTVDTAWDRALAKIAPTFVQSTDPVMKKALEDAIFARRIKFFNEHEAMDNSGVLAFKTKDGKPVLSKLDGKHKSMDEIVSEIFTDFVDPKRQAGGAGSGGGGNGGAGGGGGTPPLTDWKTIAELPGTIKNRVQLHDYLVKEQKMDQSTREFSEAFNGLAGKFKLPLR